MSPVHYGVHGAMASQGKITSVSIWRCARWCQTFHSFGNRQKRNKKRKSGLFRKPIMNITPVVYQTSVYIYNKIQWKGFSNGLCQRQHQFNHKEPMRQESSCRLWSKHCIPPSGLCTCKLTDLFQQSYSSCKCFQCTEQLFLLYLFFCMHCTAQHPEQPKGERKNKSRNKRVRIYIYYRCSSGKRRL